MKYCPITYDLLHKEEQYSSRGLHLLSPQLKNLKPLAWSAVEQRTQAIARAGKMSIQGVQTKLSAQLKIKDETFELVDQHGHYILKPQSETYPQLPENEAITMTLASLCGIDVPIHGLVHCQDNSMTYFIKRFDRKGHRDKIAVEDFTQLSNHTRDTKYNSSMEQVAKIVQTYCTFPRIEAIKLLKLTIFNYLVGNEDMHLKNFSLIRRDNLITLSPAYDLLNTTIAQPNTKEEIALPLNGKKHNLTRRDFFEYYANYLQLSPVIIQNMEEEIIEIISQWEKIIKKSYLTKDMQEKYIALFKKRCEHLKLN